MNLMNITGKGNLRSSAFAKSKSLSRRKSLKKGLKYMVNMR